MERTNTRNPLITTIENSLVAVIESQGHVDDGYCLACDDSAFVALKQIETILDTRPDWPMQLHRQYMEILKERDELQQLVDDLEEEKKTEESEPKSTWVWRFGCKHGIPNFQHCSECDGTRNSET